MMRWTILQSLFCAVVASAYSSSPSCSINLQSRSLHMPCEVNVTRCDDRVQTLSLFSPPVNNLQVSVEMLQDEASNEYLGSQATMRWLSPDNSESLIGFLIHLQTVDGRSNTCYLLSIPGTAQKDNPEFEFYLPLTPNTYNVRVHSHVEKSLVHGSPYTVPRRTIVIKDRKKAYRNSPAFWVTDLVVCSNSCSKSMTVTFELGPANYNFSVYTVGLRNESTTLKTKLHVVHDQRQGTVRFENLTPGYYNVVMSPENTDWTDQKLCRCRCGAERKKDCRGRACLDGGCLDIVSGRVANDNVNQSVCYLVTDDPLLPTKISGIGIGCFLAIGLIALVAWILLRPKHIEKNVHLLEQQKVLVLYLADDECHSEVIHHLLHFLNRHCNCSVRTLHDDEHLISQDPFSYMHNVLFKSNKILLINSDGFVDGSPRQASSDPLDPMVQLFHKHLRPERIKGNENHKLLIARFDYTAPNDTAGRIDYRQHEYQLMQEVELLVLHVHGLEKRKGRCVYHLRGVLNSLRDSPEGRMLSSSVSLRQAISVNDLVVDGNARESVVSGFTDTERGFDDIIARLNKSMGETYDSDPSDELLPSVWQKAPDGPELLHEQLIPPSPDSSSFISDGETQHWSSEINADFDSHNSPLTSWTT